MRVLPLLLWLVTCPIFIGWLWRRAWVPVDPRVPYAEENERIYQRVLRLTEMKEVEPEFNPDNVYGKLDSLNAAQQGHLSLQSGHLLNLQSTTQNVYHNGLQNAVRSANLYGMVVVRDTACVGITSGEE
jgi:hypothetical protein